MLHPSYKEMIRKINDTANEEDMQITSRYSLVIAAAKRARQINSGSEPLVEAAPKEKNLSVAVDELFSGRVHILEENDEEVSDETDELTDSEEEADQEEDESEEQDIFSEGVPEDYEEDPQDASDDE